MQDETVRDVLLTDIEISDDNVRHSEQDRDLQELADSIRKHGQLQPAVLMGVLGKPPYQLIVGQRRFLAHRMLKRPTIRAIFIPKMNMAEAKVCSLVENMCRTELTYNDAADAITWLYIKYARDAQRVHKETGLSVRKIHQYVDIEERASEETKKKLRQGKVKPVDVHRALQAAHDDIDKADELLQRMQNYDSNEKKRLVEYGKSHPGASVAHLVRHAEEPEYERNVIVRLPDNVRRALQAAAKAMSMDPDEVAARAVEEWLSDQGFMK
jgi:ParB family chromosome partitioning protein